MPRRTIESWTPLARPSAPLAERLAAELQNDREVGQPLIYEQSFRTGKRRVVVVWDAWDGLPLEERSATIYRAYELAFGSGEAEHVALATGLTVPEAHAGGLLGYQIIPALRRSDPVTSDQVRLALLEEGGSALFAPGTVQLRFATQAEAEASRDRLLRRFPETDEVWLIAQEPPLPDGLG